MCRAYQNPQEGGIVAALLNSNGEIMKKSIVIILIFISRVSAMEDIDSKQLDNSRRSGRVTTSISQSIVNYLQKGQTKEAEELLQKKNNKLNLRFNDLRMVPSRIGLLVKLTILRLDNNRLKVLPDEMKCLTNLQHLNISGNYLEQIPEWIGMLTKLTALDVERNQLHYLYDDKLIELKKLELIDNVRQLALAHNFLLHTSLVNWFISHEYCKLLKTGIGLLSNLRELNFSSNRMQKISPIISNLTALTILDLSYNKITELPEAFEELIDLKGLYLDGNKLERVMFVIENLPNLQELSLNVDNLSEEEQLEVKELIDARNIHRCYHELGYIE